MLCAAGIPKRLLCLEVAAKEQARKANEELLEQIKASHKLPEVCMEFAESQQISIENSSVAKTGFTGL